MTVSHKYDVAMKKKKQQKVKVMDLAQKNDGRRRYNGLLYPVANSPRQRGREGKYCVRKATDLMHKKKG